MLVHDLIEYSDNYLRTSRCLYQFFRDEPKNTVTDSKSFRFKSKLLNNTSNTGNINVEIAVPLKYSSNFWRALEMSFINCEINLILTYSAKYVISKRGRETTFAKTDTNFNAPVLTLST